MASWSVYDDEPTPEPYPEELNDSDLKNALLGKMVEGSILWHDGTPIGIYSGLTSLPVLQTGLPVLQNGDTISIEWGYKLT